MINQRYKIKKLLGKGRSAVYLCEDVDSINYSSGKTEKQSGSSINDIAIKILPADVDPAEAAIFRNEFFTLHKLNHPNIIKSIDFGTVVKIDEEDKDVSVGSKFFTLEYYNGNELPGYKNSTDEVQLTEIIKQLCSVLYYLHLSNYIYYDLKPENILVSNVDGKPLIKLIDLGFAQYTVGNFESTIRGTAEYLAPEILKNEKHDHRVDFYSLGMLLYRIIYGDFPFATTDELEIYKAHIEMEIDFPEVNLSNKIIDVVKKLLRKDPEERHYNSIQILDDLDIPVTEELYKDWVPAKVFADRKDFLTILKTYIADLKSNEVFTVHGSEGAGKSALVYEIYSSFDDTVFVDNPNSLTGINFARSLLEKIVYNDFVFPKLSNQLLGQIEEIFKSEPDNLSDELKSIINKLASEASFILLLDAFNNYDSFTLELFKSIIPIFQVNHVKIILTENTDKHFASDFISNLREINLTPFTEVHLLEFLEKSFSPLFPKDELKQLILSYADLLPGSLESFLRDIILLKIITFTPGGVLISKDEKSISLLKSSHEEIYNIRVKGLSNNELEIAQFISAFEIFIDQTLIAKFFKLKPEKVFNLLSSLYNKNIIHQVQSNQNPAFISEGLKRHIYSKISDKKDYHSKAADFLKKNFSDFNKPELARQFELAEKFEESYKISKEELNLAGKIFAFSYQKNILQHIINFPLNDNIKIEIEFELCKVLTKLNDYPSALKLIDKLLQKDIEGKMIYDLLIFKANCLTGSGELQKGKELLETLISKSDDPVKKNRILLDIATINFNLNQYDEASKIFNDIINRKDCEEETKGSCFQVMGLISIYKDDDLDSALQYFEKANSVYENSSLRFKQAQILMNIGNIYSMKGDSINSTNYWNRSLDINKSIGNIQQEAKLFLNFGIYYYNNLEFEKSTNFYQKALSIFFSLGIKDGLGLVKSNLGEVFLSMCEYQNALESLKDSIEIFRQLQNKEEELQALFMLGKLYFIIGDFEQLNQIIKIFESEMNEGTVAEKHKLNHQYLVCLFDTSGEDLEPVLKSLINIKNKLSAEEGKYDYYQCIMMIINVMIRLSKPKEAYKELLSEFIIKICQENNLLDAERNYVLGKLSESEPSLGLKSQIDYYQSAYELIQNLHITELTWKILFALSDSYNKRGNLNKAKDFVKYSKELINFIAGNIKDSRLKNIYLQEPERKQTIERLEYFEAQF
ncbi:MAG: protein kinase [Bacteroidetes bacterium]|nr:protein kinase [Bacteroidota bacterium]